MMQVDESERGSPMIAVASEGVIDVIVPVYGGDEDTRRCLASLHASSVRCAFEIVVVDDCSPDPALSAWLDAEAAAGRITLLRNEMNRGFVASVNRGMTLHFDRDVVLLNSDTEVAGDWLDRLRACVDAAPDIGTATPFSNNATICSYPFEGWQGEVPGALGLAGLDAVFARVHSGRALDLPSAVGFCMYIRRRCLNAVGLFDEARFGRGYGEENDFSRRAVAAGWRNVLCADVFVHHRGGVSFGSGRTQLMQAAGEALRAAHPDYDEVVRRFILHDPVAPLRAQVSLARAALGGCEFAAVVAENAQALEVRRLQGRRLREALPVKLHITHKWGGGIERWVRDFCDADLAARNLVLRGRTSRNETAFQLELVDPQLGQTPLRVWDLQTPVLGTAVGHAEYREVLDWVCRSFEVRAVYVSSLIGHSLDALETGLPTTWVMHDMYPFCPALFAWFEQPCTQCGITELSRCLTANPHNIFWHVTDGESWMQVRRAFEARISDGGLTIVAPSRDVHARYAQLLPPLLSKPWQRVPHGLGGAIAGAVRSRPRPVTASTRLRVLVPGRLLPHKGLGVLEAVYPNLHAFADLILLGCGDFGRAFEGLPGVRVIPDYEIDALPAYVADLEPDCALLLSILPESYSYTLSEMRVLGVPVVATNQGAFAERIRDGVDGFLVAPTPAAVVGRLQQFAADRTVLDRVAELVRAMPVRTAFEMVADYDDLLPADWRGQGGRVSVEMAIQTLAERLWLQDEVARLHDRLGGALGDAARLQADVHAHALVVRNREERIAALEAERDAMLNSASWRVTRPLRRIERLLAAPVSTAVGAGVEAEPPHEAEVSSPVVEVGRHSAGLPVSRSAARQSVREALGLPDSARVVGGAGAGPAWERFVELASRVTAGDTRTAFVWLGETSLPDGVAGRVPVAAVLASTRDLFIADALTAEVWMRGIDLYCAGPEDEAWRSLAAVCATPLLSCERLGGDVDDHCRAVLKALNTGT